MKNTWKLFVSSLVAIIVTSCIALHGEMSDGMWITGVVSMYYLLWISFYGILEYVEEKLKGDQRSE